MPSPESNGRLADVLARLDRLTDWERRPRAAMRVDLQPIADLMQRLGNPHARLRIVQVTGTKGKGSVCALIEAGLRRAGLRVGRYASPHLECVTERIGLLGRPVDKDALAGALAEVLDHHEAARAARSPAAEASWFDVMTAAAFLLFDRAGLDWAVVEVGLGGRLDSTNVADAEIAVVTNIELEHVEVLGPTRTAIAAEKGGILKPGATLVTALAERDDAYAVLRERADRLGCPILRADAPADATIAEKNAALAGLVLDHMGRQGEAARFPAAAGTALGAWLLDEETRREARLPGRQERRAIAWSDDSGQEQGTVPVVLDGAHVPFNLAAVIDDLVRDPDLKGDCTAIVALGADKDAPAFLAVLARHASRIIFTDLPAPGRGHPAGHLQAIADALGATSEVEPDAGTALARGAWQASRAGGWVLVTGSLHLVGRLRNGPGPMAGSRAAARTATA